MTISFNTGTNASADQASTVNITIPSGVLVGDVMLMVLEVFSETASPPTVSITGGGGGWTLPSVTDGSANPQTASGGGLFSYGYVYYRVATSGDPGQTLTVSVTGASGGPWLDIALAAYTGAKSPPVDVLGGANANVAGTTGVTCPTLATGVNGDWAVFLYAGSVGSGDTLTGPSGSTSRENVVSGQGIGAAINDSNGSVGNSGTNIGGGKFTSNNASAIWATGFTLGLQPAGGAHTATASLTVTPSFASHKGMGLVQKMTVTPSFAMHKGVGKAQRFTVQPAFANTRTAVYHRVEAMTVRPVFSVSFKGPQHGGNVDRHHRGGGYR